MSKKLFLSKKSCPLTKVINHRNLQSTERQKETKHHFIESVLKTVLNNLIDYTDKILPTLITLEFTPQ
jgi:hypothetical protein